MPVTLKVRLRGSLGRGTVGLRRRWRRRVTDLLLTEHDVAGIADVMARLLFDPERAVAIGAAGWCTIPDKVGAA
jgi:hypothetical protein